LSWPDSVARVLVRTCCEEAALPGDPSLAPPYEDAARFVALELASMPDVLGFPMKALTLLFDLEGLARSGRLFHRQGQRERRAQVASWRRSGLAFRRDFIRFYGGLSAYALFARKHEGLPDG